MSLRRSRAPLSSELVTWSKGAVDSADYQSDWDKPIIIGQKHSRPAVTKGSALNSLSLQHRKGARLITQLLRGQVPRSRPTSRVVVRPEAVSLDDGEHSEIGSAGGDVQLADLSSRGSFAHSQACGTGCPETTADRWPSVSVVSLSSEIGS